ncbi:MAG: hypothetical protein JSS79_10415 [Bacteroidetes bacterium]|nr:hypothetical protein [Bacteroidota bacterium]
MRSFKMESFNKIGFVKTAVLFSLIFISSCKPKTVDQADSKDFDLRGSWVQIEYRNSLQSDRSPLKAYKTFDGGVTDLNIGSGKNLPFQIEVRTGNHQGGFVWTVKDKTDESFDVFGFTGLSSSEISFKLKLEKTVSDTSLIMMDNVKKRKFVKVSNEPLTDPYRFLISKEIFSGRYNVSNSKNEVQFKDVTFDANGRVQGFGDFKEYSATSDFAAQPEDIEMIHFNTDDSFEFESRGDDILLFERNPIDDYTTDRGLLKFKLIRKN